MFRTAHELCQTREVPLSASAVARLDWTESPLAYIRRLVAADLLADARRVLAQALPPREALAWGSRCLRDGFYMTPAFESALDAVDGYIADPTDARRRATEASAAEVGLDSAAGVLALAAFFSDGSLLPPDLPVVAPKPFITGQLVSVAVYLAAVQRDPAHYKEHLRQYLDDAETRLESLSAPRRERVEVVA